MTKYLKSKYLVALLALSSCNPAAAALIQIGWSGFVEPQTIDENPWGLNGDGIVEPPNTDGSIFSVQVTVSTSAEDYSQNPSQAAYEPEALAIVIGGVTAEVLWSAIWINDNLPSDIDTLSISAFIEIAGVAGYFGTGLGLESGAISLDASVAPDPFPTLNSQFSVSTIFSITQYARTTTNSGTYLTVTNVPLPPTLALLVSGVLVTFTACGRRRPLK